MTELTIYCKTELDDDVITLDIHHFDDKHIGLHIKKNHEFIDDLNVIMIENENIPLLILQLQTLLKYNN
jgi:hypothetical protein